jgi:hypothetical protein
MFGWSDHVDTGQASGCPQRWRGCPSVEINHRSAESGLNRRSLQRDGMHDAALMSMVSARTNPKRRLMELEHLDGQDSRPDF